MPLIDLNGLGYFKGKENAMIADTYSATKTYAVGDYVYYSGTLYKCKTAITTAEAWTAAHWETAKLANDVDDLKNSIIQNHPLNFASGSPVQFDDAINAQFAKIEVLFEPTQSGSGTPSIENERPISGTSSVEISIKKSSALNLIDTNGLTLESSSGDKVLVIADNVVLDAGTYTIQRNQVNAITSSVRNQFIIMSGSTQIANGDTSTTGNSAGIHYTTFTLDEQKTLKFLWWIHTPSASVTCNNFMLETGSTVSEYVPYYVPQEINEVFTGSIYKGSYDAVSGTIKMVMGYITFNGSASESWQSSANGLRYVNYATSQFFKKNTSASDKIGLLCNIFTEATPNGTYTGVVGVSVDDQGNLAICPTGTAMTETEFRTFLGNHNVSICYPMQSESTESITPNIVNSYDGKNIISANGYVINTNYYGKPRNNQSSVAVKTITKSIVVVDANGNGDYLNIQDAINACTDIDSNKALTGTHCTIYVMPGIYPRFSMGKGGNTGVPLRSISIIGLDKKSCIVKDDTGLYNYPPAEIRTNGTIANMTFYATHDDGDSETSLSKDQYAVHIDFGTCSTVFENCDFISYSNSAVGMGLAQDMSVVFDNCHFENRGDGTWGRLTNGAFYCHTKQASDVTGQKLTLKNCEAICPEGAIGALLQVLSSGNSSMELNLYNNMFYSGSGATATIQNGWDVSKCFGNNISVS